MGRGRPPGEGGTAAQGLGRAREGGAGARPGPEGPPPARGLRSLPAAARPRVTGPAVPSGVCVGAGAAPRPREPMAGAGAVSPVPRVPRPGAPPRLFSFPGQVGGRRAWGAAGPVRGGSRTGPPGVPAALPAGLRSRGSRSRSGSVLLPGPGPRSLSGRLVPFFPDDLRLGGRTRRLRARPGPGSAAAELSL